MTNPTDQVTDFRIFIQKIALQGFYALGLLDIPGAPKLEQPNMQAARMVIDDLIMIRERTNGNLSEGEVKTIDKFITDLQLQFVELSKTTEVANA